MFTPIGRLVRMQGYLAFGGPIAMQKEAHAMSQLTAEERRRTLERRRSEARLRDKPRAIAIGEFAGRARDWSRRARFGALLALLAAAGLPLPPIAVGTSLPAPAPLRSLP